MAEQTRREIATKMWNAVVNKHLKLCKQLWDWEMDRDWRPFKVPARKNLHCCEWIVKSDSGKNSERKEKNCKKFPSSQRTINRVLVGIWMMKAILIRSQSEM